MANKLVGFRGANKLGNLEEGEKSEMKGR